MHLSDKTYLKPSPKRDCIASMWEYTEFLNPTYVCRNRNILRLLSAEKLPSRCKVLCFQSSKYLRKTSTSDANLSSPGDSYGLMNRFFFLTNSLEDLTFVQIMHHSTKSGCLEDFFVITFLKHKHHRLALYMRRHIQLNNNDILL